MKQLILKTSFVVFSFFASHYVFSANLNDLYNKSNQMTQNLYHYGYMLTPEQINKIDELLDRIQFVYDFSPEVCGDYNEVFETTYQWATSWDNLNYFSDKAERFAENIAQKPCPALYFTVFKQAFKYAADFSGLNKSKSNAVVFAEIISDYEQHHFYPKTTLKCFKTQYEFARKWKMDGGLGKTRSEAELFAIERCLNNQLPM